MNEDGLMVTDHVYDPGTIRNPWITTPMGIPESFMKLNFPDNFIIYYRCRPLSRLRITFIIYSLRAVGC